MTSEIKPHKIKARLELLGIGSAKNKALKSNLEEALRQLSLSIPIEEIQDLNRLLESNISGIPALLVNGKVVFQKVVPSVEDLKIVLNVLLCGDAASRLPARIIVPVDFSGTAENAVRFGADLAYYLGSKMEVVHIHSNAVELSSTLKMERPTDVRAYKKRLLKSLRDRLVKQHPGFDSIINVEMVEGAVVEKIREYSKDEQAMIVMGTTGESRVLGQWLGTISYQVAQRAHCPVLLVPKDVTFREFQKVVYASSYHPDEERVLPEVAGFAALFGAQLFFAHITQQKLHPYEVHFSHNGQAIQQNGVAIQLANIESDDVVSGLNRFMEETEADLLVMATSRRSFLEEMFHRSTTRRMLFNTSRPILVFHF